MKKVLALSALLAMLCGSAQALETSIAAKVRQLQTENPKTGLFVGNSFTYYNCGVNGYVRGLTKEAQKQWKARMITISAGRLSFHDVAWYLQPHEADPYFKDGNKKPFDVVFLQAQSSEPIAKKYAENYKKYLKQHIESVRATGAEPVVVVTWARQDKPQDTRVLADAMISAANENNAIALPVGLAFAESLKMRPDLILHHTDQLHPSAAGSYLYGAMVYALLYKQSPEGLKFPGDCAKPLPEADVKHLQQVAWKVVKEFYGW